MYNFSWIGNQKLITLIVQVGVEPVKPFRKWEAAYKLSIVIVHGSLEQMPGWWQTSGQRPQLLIWFNYNPNMDK